MRIAATRRPRRIAAAMVLMCGMTLVLAGAWPAVSSAAPAPITDFANYPPAAPASCTVDGAAVVPGVQFTSNGQTASDLRALTLTAGSTVTMTWPSFAPGCESLGIGLSYKIAQQASFNPDHDQYLHSFVYCGPEGPACSSPGSLTLTIPAASVVPCGQLDAHIGPPLAIVGPHGRYYNFGNPRNMLISAWNGGTMPCDVPPCPSTPNMPEGAMLCQTGAQQTGAPTATTPNGVTTTPPGGTTPTPTSAATAPDNAAPGSGTPGSSAPPPTSSAAAPEVCASNPSIPASSPACSPAGSSDAAVAAARAAQTAQAGQSAQSAQNAAAAPGTAAQPGSAGACAPGQQVDALGVCVETSVLGARVQAAQAQAQSVQAAQAAGLPRTGTSTRMPLMVAGVLLMLGTPLVLVFRRRPGRHSVG